MRDRSHDVFRALADAHRRRILSALCGKPMVAGDLGRLVRLAPNAVSFHLKELREAGLVRVEREGRFLRYHADSDVLNQWRSRVEELFVTGGVRPDRPASRSSFPAREESGDRERVGAASSAARSTDDVSDALPTELL